MFDDLDQLITTAKQAMERLDALEQAVVTLSERLENIENVIAKSLADASKELQVPEELEAIANESAYQVLGMVGMRQQDTPGTQ